MSTSTSVQPPPSQLHEGHSLIASCPKCSSQLVIPLACPRWRAAAAADHLPGCQRRISGRAMYPGAGVPPPLRCPLPLMDPDTDTAARW